MKAYRRRKKFVQTEAIALKVYDFGDADRIFVFLTPNNGLIKVVAKGIRKPKSKMGGHIDVLSKIKVKARNWEDDVPSEVVNAIKYYELFGYKKEVTVN